MDPLNILHVVNIVAPRYGGAGIASQLIACYQTKIGHNVTICTTNIDYPRGTLAVPSGKPVFRDRILIRHFEVSFRPLLTSIPLWKWLKAMISSFDIVHIHGLYRFPVSVAAWYARKANVPYLVSLHGCLDPFLYKQSRYNIFLKRIYELFIDFPNLNRADAIHYTAEEEAKRSSFLRLRPRPVILPNGIDWESYRLLPLRGNFRRRLMLNNQAPLVLFLGRINFTKGLDLLVPAFTHVAQQFQNARLAIVGPDNDGYGSKVRRWCVEQGIKDKVFIVDYLEPAMVREAYVDANVFVLPSYTENFGLTVIEAMACGTPVIISNQVNIWREVQEAKAGIVVGIDTRSLADAICHLLSDHQGAQAMGARGRIAAEKRYAWPHIVRQLTGVYRELINERRSSVGFRRNH